jgi:hypothetical protein
MSALGHKQTFAGQKGMSALPPKADMCSALAHVRYVPKADICSALGRVTTLLSATRPIDVGFGSTPDKVKH